MAAGRLPALGPGSKDCRWRKGARSAGRKKRRECKGPPTSAFGFQACRAPERAPAARRDEDHVGLGIYQRLLEDGDSVRIQRLATCLRLAEYFERGRGGRVRDLEVSVERKAVRIGVIASEPPRVEMWEAQKQAGLFVKAFGRKLILENAETD